MMKNKLVKKIKGFLSLKSVRIILCIFIAIGMFLTILFNSIEKETFSTDYYNKYSRENNLKGYVGVTQEKLDEMYSKLILYIQTGREYLLDDFNERETKHMRDVYSLYRFGDSITSVLIFEYLTIIYFILARKSKIKYENIKYIRNTFIGIILFIGIVSIYAYMDFNNAFVYFHKIFFSNDLWLLDPKTDIMIRMLPQEYFMNMAFNIFKRFIFEFGIVFIVTIVYTAVNKKGV